MYHLQGFAAMLGYTMEEAWAPWEDGKVCKKGPTISEDDVLPPPPGRLRLQDPDESWRAQASTVPRAERPRNMQDTPRRSRVNPQHTSSSSSSSSATALPPRRAVEPVVGLPAYSWDPQIAGPECRPQRPCVTSVNGLQAFPDNCMHSALPFASTLDWTSFTAVVDGAPLRCAGEATGRRRRRRAEKRTPEHLQLVSCAAQISTAIYRLDRAELAQKRRALYARGSNPQLALALDAAAAHLWL